MRGRCLLGSACGAVCAVCVWAVLLVSAGCYRYRVVASGEAGANPSTFPRTETLHSFLWGFLQDNSLTSVCAEDEALSSVRATTNLGFALITVITVGIYAPAQVEYQCVNPTPDTGVIGGRDEGR
jgi:Bor protein